VWAAPVLAFQWAYGHRALMHNRRVWVSTIVLSTAALCLADQWAIRGNIWHIEERFSVGHMTLLGLPDLPLEEFVFFLATSTMCAWGLTLAMIVTGQWNQIIRVGTATQTRCDTPFVRALLEVHQWKAFPTFSPSVGAEKGLVAASASTRPTVNASKCAWSIDSLHLAFAWPIAAAALLLFGCLGYEPSFSVQAKAFLCTTILLGVPHGAFDPILIQTGLRGAKSASFFGRIPSKLRDGASFSSSSGRSVRGAALAWGGYFLLMGLTYAVWYAYPPGALCAFIVVSVAHFGEGDVGSSNMRGGFSFTALRHGPLEMFVRGGSFLVATATFPGQVRMIFHLLLVDGRASPDDGSLVAVMAVVAWLRWLHLLATALFVLGVSTRLNERGSLVSLVEVCLLNALFRVCPPLVAFAIYFNAFHSLRHIIRVAKFSPQLVAARGRSVAVVFTMLAVVPILVISTWSGKSVSSGVAWLEDSVRLLFMALSVLTTPHMVVVTLLRLTAAPSSQAKPLEKPW